MLRRVRANYGVDVAGSLHGGPFDDRDRAWGLMPVSECAEAVEETFQRDYVPRFEGLGFTLS